MFVTLSFNRRVSDTEKQEALNRLDTIRQYITDGKMTFEEAAYYFSTDKKTRNNGGLFADPQTSEARIARPDIPGDMAREVNKMKPGEISQPFNQSYQRPRRIQDRED